MEASNATFGKAEKWIRLCRILYNTALEQRILIYRQNKGQISYYDQTKQLPELKLYFPEYAEVDAQVLGEVLGRLDNAYGSLFRRLNEHSGKPGFPRFKGKERYSSFTLKQHSWKLDGKYLTINRLGRFKLHLSQEIKGVIKTVTIRKEASGRWYVCFSCDNVPAHRLRKVSKSVGIDVGVKSFLVDSEGTTIDNPKYLRKAEALLRCRERSRTRKLKGSHRRAKSIILTAKLHDKIKNQRNDFLHKLSTSYIKRFGLLVFEDLNIDGMVKNHHIAKSVNDCSWGRFYDYCAYKAAEAGRQIVRVNRFEPTSKTCSSCGSINQELRWSDRQWICKECGVLHDRDYNAAKNIKRVGQTQQVLTCGNTQSVACESSRPTKRGLPKAEGHCFCYNKQVEKF